jgi:hypothetical protein
VSIFHRPQKRDLTNRSPLFTMFRSKKEDGYPGEPGQPLVSGILLPAAELPHWATTEHDAHYQIGCIRRASDGNPEQEQPRVNKSGFGLLAQRGMEFSVEAVVADYDRNPKSQLAGTDEDKVVQLITEKAAIIAAIEKAGLDKPWMIGPTLNGWRSIWSLTKRVPVRSIADYNAVKAQIAGVIALLRQNGLGPNDPLQADASCSNPNRLFRAFNVLRDGVLTAEADYMRLEGVTVIEEGSPCR